MTKILTDMTKILTEIKNNRYDNIAKCCRQTQNRSSRGEEQSKKITTGIRVKTLRKQYRENRKFKKYVEKVCRKFDFLIENRFFFNVLQTLFLKLS